MYFKTLSYIKTNTPLSPKTRRISKQLAVLDTVISIIVLVCWMYTITLVATFKHSQIKSCSLTDGLPVPLSTLPGINIDICIWEDAGIKFSQTLGGLPVEVTPINGTTFNCTTATFPQFYSQRAVVYVVNTPNNCRLFTSRDDKKGAMFDGYVSYVVCICINRDKINGTFQHSILYC